MAYKSKEERKDEIMRWAVTHDMGEQYSAFTATQIAKALGMSVSTHLRKILWELCEEGNLVWSQHNHRPNVIKTNYYLAPDVRVRYSLL